MKIRMGYYPTWPEVYGYSYVVVISNHPNHQEEVVEEEEEGQ